MMALRDALQYFDTLHCDRSKHMGEAPHKPILLMSIMRLYEHNQLQGNCIAPNHPQLRYEFERTWAEFVFTRHQCRLALPFFHMRSEPFWSLIVRPGCETQATRKEEMRHLSKLVRAISHAEIAVDVANLMADASTREILFDFLVSRYFNGHHAPEHTIHSTARPAVKTEWSASNDDTSKNRLQAA